MVTDKFFDLQRFAGIDANNGLWEEISTLGSDTDTVAAHKGRVYKDFYSLNTSEVATFSVAGFSNDDAIPQTVSSTINIVGLNQPLGTQEAVGTAAHVTLSTGSGTSVGAVPINIQANENNNVVDVGVNLASSNYPSTVVVGTTGAVDASHYIQLSNAGGYGYLGALATGQNVLQAGTTGAMLRHVGTVRASILGGAGNDTLRPGASDYVVGGSGTDFFMDTNAYAIQDYDPTTDVIIATGIDSISEITTANVTGTVMTNKIGIGEGKQLTLANKEGNEALQIQVAVLDNDGNVTAARRDVLVANGNGNVSVASGAGNSLNSALIIANSLRGGAVNMIVGSANSDTIYVGNNDYVDGGGGNDSIIIDEESTGVGVAITGNGGTDTVENWVFGFNQYPNDVNNGATKLEVGGAAFQGRVVEDRLQISVTGGGTMVFEDTKNLGSKHGQYDVLIGTNDGDRKYTAIRDGGYASVTSNDEVADYYLSDNSNIDPAVEYANRTYGFVEFTSAITEDLDDFGDENGYIRLDGDRFNAIRDLRLNNSSHASVVGSSARETVSIGGALEASASKAVSLAGDNDVIYSSGDTGTGNTFYFGAGDGRDTIHNFGHYLGVNSDPEKQKADKLYLTSFAGLRVDSYSDGDRVVFNATDSDDVVIYESSRIDTNNKFYQVEIQGFGAKIAKIGYSDSVNTFTYNEEVSYYVGSSGNDRDALTLSNTDKQVAIRLDGLTVDGTAESGNYYRGIKTLDASAATDTNISLVGGTGNNEITAGGEGTFNSLWGGAGDNTLNGGAGKDTFLYYKDSAVYVRGAAEQASGNHDVINNYDNENDVIFLGDITVDDLNVAAMEQDGNLGIGSDKVIVEFKNGGSLTVNGSSDTTFYMSDGQVYTAERSSGQWVRNA